MQESSLYDAVQEIDYLDKVVLETLRLHSPAPRYGIMYEVVTIKFNITSSCTRSARFFTCARSLLCSLCHCALQLFCVVEYSASLAPTQHIYKLVSEHYRDCNGNSSAHVQGRRQLDLVLLLSGLCNTTLTYRVNVL